MGFSSFSGRSLIHGNLIPRDMFVIFSVLDNAAFLFLFFFFSSGNKVFDFLAVLSVFFLSG